MVYLPTLFFMGYMFGLCPSPCPQFAEPSRRFHFIFSRLPPHFCRNAATNRSSPCPSWPPALRIIRNTRRNENATFILWRALRQHFGSLSSSATPQPLVYMAVAALRIFWGVVVENFLTVFIAQLQKPGPETNSSAQGYAVKYNFYI